MVEPTMEHVVNVFSAKPWSASAPFNLLVCEDSMTVESIEAACLRGKCPKGHIIILEGPAAKEAMLRFEQRNVKMAEARKMMREGRRLMKEAKEL